MRYWQPLGAKTTVTGSLLHPENERQKSVDSFMSCTFGNRVIAQIFTHTTELLTALLGKTATYQRKHTDSKLINIANCQTWKDILLVAENAILIRY